MDRATTRRHKPNRMAEYDYASAGVYVITVVVYERRCCLGHVDGEDFVSSDAGRIIRSAWERLFARFPTIMLDAFVVMPNHVHGIIVLGAEPGFGREVAMNGDATVSPVASPFMAASPSPTTFSESRSTNLRSLRPPSRDPLVPALGEIVRSLKAASTTRIRKECLPDFRWQDGYWDRIVRNEPELERFRGYIMTNPVRWTLDREYADQ